MTDNNNSAAPPGDRRKKKRRLNKDRREHARWDINSPFRRQNPGRRALDRLLQALNLIKK